MKPNTLGFIGMRLREAREARELTIAALADLIGVSRQAIYLYEHEIQSPRPEIMEKIANLLHLPIPYFRCHHGIEIGTIFYRSMSATAKLARLRAKNRYLWIRIIDSYFRGFIQFPNPNFPKFEMPNNPNQISETDIEELATRTRKYWNLSDAPIENMVLLLENNGAIVAYDELGARALDAFSEPSPISGCVQYIILGSDKATSVRSRFDAAHELGHKILHWNIDKSYLLRKAEHSLIENQAHRFASAFLLPADAFGNDFYSANLDALKSIKPKWKTSIAMMIKRAEDLSFISSARNLWINLSRRGWKTKEPLDDVLEIERPCLLRQAFEMVIDQKIRTKQEIISQIPLSPTDIENLIGLGKGYLMEIQENAFPKISVLRDLQIDHKDKYKPQNNGLADVINIHSRRKK